MSNHVHFIVHPLLETALARTFGLRHMRYTQEQNRQVGRVGHLWQGRFFAAPLDDRYLSRVPGNESKNKHRLSPNYPLKSGNIMNSLQSIFTACCLVLLCAGLSGAGWTQTPAEAGLSALAAAGTPLVDGDRLGLLGDSITQYAEGDGGYVRLFRDAFSGNAHPKVTVINAGVSGNIVPDVQARLGARCACQASHRCLHLYRHKRCLALQR